MSRDLIRLLQAQVNLVGGHSLVVDGLYGPLTHAATMATLPAPPELPSKPGGEALVPAAWMPNARMSRIHVHWTAGNHRANATDLRHYHILVEGDGKVVRGNPSIALNEAPARAGHAAHTLNANSGAIGVAMCGMVGAVERPFNAGRAPLTLVQWNNMVHVVAELASRYGIPVTRTTVLTHAEVQPNLGIAQRGKWDIAILAFDTSFDTPAKVGDRMRNEIARLSRQEG
jgi:N-acetylmuramoyl-L-alanine amidase-like protein